MKVHAFGKSLSPGVAVYCMRRAAAEDEREHSTNAKQFVGRHFYVDELAADPTLEEAIDVLTRSQKMLAESNLKLKQDSIRLLQGFWKPFRLMNGPRIRNIWTSDWVISPNNAA